MRYDMVLANLLGSMKAEMILKAATTNIGDMCDHGISSALDLCILEEARGDPGPLVPRLCNGGVHNPLPSMHVSTLRTVYPEGR